VFESLGQHRQEAVTCCARSVSSALLLQQPLNTELVTDKRSRQFVQGGLEAAYLALWLQLDAAAIISSLGDTDSINDIIENKFVWIKSMWFM
jgi:hypothetical protein